MTEPHDVPPRRAFTCDATVLGRSVHVVFGAGTLTQVAPEARALGGRVLLVAGRHEDEAAGRVGAGLGGDVVGRLRDVTQHVPVDLAAAAVDRARELGAEVLVAIGGGSATGLAKAVALETGLPVLAVPTTYAGSEMTPVWGLTDGNGKTTGRDLRVLPRTVVYDPELTVRLPADTTASSGMNALAHALEALYAPDVTPRLADLAQGALRALATGLPGAVADGSDLDARTEAMYGAWLAGWVLGSTTMGLHHKLAHVLGGTYRLPHAGVHSALLPQVAAYNAPAAPQAFAGAARALGLDEPADVAGALFDLAERLGAPTSLAALGLRADAVDDVAAAVEAAGVPNPRAVDVAGLRRLLEAARQGHRPPTDAALTDPTPGGTR
jgi:maleylacetate reductase